MADIQIFNTQDLVLKVKKNYNPFEFKFDKWERFIDVLCEEREYQKEAIKTSIIYLYSKQYRKIEELIDENYKNSNILKERYKTLQEYYDNIQLPNKLSATIDLATGTGKSYVMYGIAQIALGLGLVSKVLILCPSLTIEKGLMEKFLYLRTNSKLVDAIPEDANYKNPKIISADQTITEGDICIENIHAVYSQTGSSIQDSFQFHNGKDCLVLNDEVHHVYNKISGNDSNAKDIKKWKEFLNDPMYGFFFILGFTGTAYINNMYFNDVIYRYSLKKAIEEKVVKSVYYNVKDEDNEKSLNIKFQKILQNHKINIKNYDKIKPITILITNNIKNAKNLVNDFTEFLVKNKFNIDLSEVYKLSTLKIKKIEQIRNKILVVTSDKAHKHNFEILQDVDSKHNPIEFIVSVSMLTEGWDVKNVYQIVPMDERAFDSKLLIAQLLGRGLRLTKEYRNSTVTVFNHDSWSGKIKGLVDEILELEKRIKNSVIINGERSIYNFDLYNIDYEKTFVEIEAKKTKVFDYKGIIKLVSQVEHYETITLYENIDGKIKPISYKIYRDMFKVKDIVNKIYEEFRVREWEGITLKLKNEEYTKNDLPPKSVLEKIVRNSMLEVGLKGDYLSKDNQKAIFNAFNTLLRKKTRSIVPTRTVKSPNLIRTTTREHESISLGNLRKDINSIFFSSNWENEIIDHDVLNVMKEVIEDGSLPRNSVHEVNSSLFKTSIDIVFTTKEPERKFVEYLCKIQNADKIEKWFKSKSQTFYTIDYSVTSDGGKHSKQLQFNPDFFLLLLQDNFEYVIVVETKMDNDVSDENRAKYSYGKQHFKDLNEQLANIGIRQKYIFNILSPKSYNDFFAYLREGKLIQNEFRSEIENLLSS